MFPKNTGNTNQQTNFPAVPPNLVVMQGYIPQHVSPGIQPMNQVMYPMMQGQNQQYIGSVPAQYYQQRPFVQTVVQQGIRPRPPMDMSPTSGRSSAFSAQQQKLKAFGVKGAKASSATMDGMIESMFGKAPEKTEKKLPTGVVPVMTLRQPVSPPPLSQPVPEVPRTPTPPVKKQAPSKSLETMMLECTNISAGAGGRRKSIGKSAVPEQKRNVPHASQQPTARFAAWCVQQSVPQVYLQVEKFVSCEGSSPDNFQVDNGRLLPVLMSSGLPKDLLARLWEVTSQTRPGALTQQELYSMLALVALCQAGYQVAGPEVLLMLGTPPIPSLALPTPVVQEDQPPASPHPTATLTPPTTSNIQDFPNDNDDDFDDFKQATWGDPHQPDVAPQPNPTMVPPTTIKQDKYSALSELESQFAPEMPEKNFISDNVNDDFGDFLSADVQFASASSVQTTTNVSTPIDIYSRTASFTIGVSDVGSSIFTPAASLNPNLQTSDSATLINDSSIKLSASELQDNLFASNLNDFATSTFGSQVSETIQPFQANFADFESQSQEVFAMSPTNEESPEDEFGLFAHNRLSPVVDSRVSETQSVASLELASSVDRLSHHGSTQSLDSKTNLGNPTAVLPADSVKHSHQRSVSDGQGLIVKGLASLSLDQTDSSLSLVDRYSSICNEKSKIGVSCIQELGRCLTSCLKILETGVQIFEQMSSAEVFHEVLAAREVQEYVQNVKEVYTVAQRIRTVVSAAGCLLDVQTLLGNVQETWDTLVNVILLPRHPGIHSDLVSPLLDFSPCVLSAAEVSRTGCGICLLDVDNPNSTCWPDSSSAQVKLSYGRSQYHATCANLWLNCVDPILPAFTVRELYAH